jgi:hypothetical protein
MSKQIIKPILCSLAITLSLNAMSLSVFAQLPPAMSPWLKLFDEPSGPLGPYLSNVKPQQELARAQAAQASQLQAQQRALQALQQSGSSGGGTGPRELEAGIGGGGKSGGIPTILAPPREIPRVQRNPAGFNQYLHYYPPHALTRKPVPNFSSTGRRW